MANQPDFEKDDMEYTPTHDLYSIQPYDTTVEIVGFVDSIESTKVVGAQSHKIFKFFLNNGAGERVQMITWNKEIQRVEHLIRINQIVHIDGAHCKPSINRNFNKGTVDYELIIQSNTVINVIGKQNVEGVEDTDPELVEIGEATKYTKCIKIHGFMKSRFAVVEKQNGKGNEFKCGSITDGEYKLEIRVPTNKDDDDEDDFDFEKGEHVEVVGFIKINANPIHFEMKTMKNIKKIDEEKMTIKQLLRGTKHLEKRIAEPKEHVVKKIKICE